MCIPIGSHLDVTLDMVGNARVAPRVLSAFVSGHLCCGRQHQVFGPRYSSDTDIRKYIRLYALKELKVNSVMINGDWRLAMKSIR